MANPNANVTSNTVQNNLLWGIQPNGTFAPVNIDANGNIGTANGAPATTAGTAFGNFVSYSPTQLGANGITLPASAGTAPTNTVDLRGVKQMTLWAICTQTFSVSANLYKEDGTPFSATYTNVATNGSNGFDNAVTFGSESNQGGALGFTAGAGIRLPQRGIAFQFVNTTATPGTCTARLFLAY